MKPGIVVSGKRKTAVARVKVVLGSSKIFFNRIPHTSLPFFHKLALEEPLDIARNVLGKVEVDLHVNTRGGGKEGQIEAARLGIAKALIALTNSVELKKAFLSYDRALLVADTRRKEAYKPGDSKARAKRQKSYR